jgi:hypothetical protein
MEDQELLSTEKTELIISETSETYLAEVKKWANFLAIMGFVGVGFMVLAGLFMMLVFSFLPDEQNVFPFPATLLGAFYLIMAAVYFFPARYLYQFSTKMKYALLERNNQFLESALGYLKSHYKFIGILVIVMLTLYPIAIVVGIFFAVMNNV